MQRRLSEIAEIPTIIQSTLQTVSKTFGQILPLEGETTTEERSNESYFHVNDEHESFELSNDENENYQLNENDIDSVSSDVELNDDFCIDSTFNNLPEHWIQNAGNAESLDSESYEGSVCDASSDGQPDLTTACDEETEREMNENDILKASKRQKIQDLERSWPWADREKIIYKRSNCHLVPSLSIVKERVKQLTELNVLKFHQNQ